MPRPTCPKCGEKQCSRRKREGLFQLLLWPYFGYFPWQCSACRKVFTVKTRGKSKRRSRDTVTYSSAEANSTTVPHDHSED